MPRCHRDDGHPASRRRPLLVAFVAASALFLGSLGGCASAAGETDPGAAEAPLTLSARSRRIQRESFRTVYETVRDRHWDEERVGEPWRASYEELRPRLDEVSSQAEARAVMNRLLETLGQSHFGVFPGPRDEEELVPADDPRALREDATLTVATASSGGGGDATAGAAETPATRDEAAPAEADEEEGYPGFETEVVEGRLMVTRVSPHSPAARSGVETGWEVVGVGEHLAADVLENLADDADEPMAEIRSLRIVARFVQGPRDSIRAMSFRDRSGRRRELEIRMVGREGADFRMGEQLDLPTRTEVRELPGGVAYYALGAFGNPAPVMKEFGAMLRRFASAPGLVIDLRNNPGGIGMMASGLAGFFVEERGLDLGRMITRAGGLKFVIFPRAETFPGKVAVLVNGASASTSEIFAAGLQDIGRARVFGTTTAGAVLPSEIITLPNGDGFQFATADFEAPSGTRLEGRGAVPDQISRHTVEALRRGEDRVLEEARRWILSFDS